MGFQDARMFSEKSAPDTHIFTVLTAVAPDSLELFVKRERIYTEDASRLRSSWSIGISIDFVGSVYGSGRIIRDLLILSFHQSFSLSYKDAYVKKKRKTMNTTKTPILGKISLINLTRCDGTIVSEWGKWTMLNRLHIPRAAGHTLNNRVETTRM